MISLRKEDGPAVTLQPQCWPTDHLAGTAVHRLTAGACHAGRRRRHPRRAAAPVPLGAHPIVPRCGIAPLAPHREQPGRRARTSVSAAPGAFRMSAAPGRRGAAWAGPPPPPPSPRGPPQPRSRVPRRMSAWVTSALMPLMPHAPMTMHGPAPSGALTCTPAPSAATPQRVRDGLSQVRNDPLTARTRPAHSTDSTDSTLERASGDGAVERAPGDGISHHSASLQREPLPLPPG